MELEGAGLKGRMVDILRAAYKECKCEVKVGDMVSELFDVVKSLRQGCILSPVLCSLYINSLVDKVREEGIRVECRSQRIPALLYADGLVILADDEKMLRRALYEMGEWCVEWSVKVNVKTSGIMHMRRKRVNRMGQRFAIGGELV